MIPSRATVLTDEVFCYDFMDRNTSQHQSESPFLRNNAVNQCLYYVPVTRAIKQIICAGPYSFHHLPAEVLCCSVLYGFCRESVWWVVPDSKVKKEQKRIVLTPSLPQPVKILGQKMQGRACKQCIFPSCNVYFQCCTL